MGQALVGDCVGDEMLAATGGRFQTTTRGLLIQSDAGDWTAFTDGQTTWINGANGLETAGPARPAAPATVNAPPPATILPTNRTPEAPPGQKPPTQTLPAHPAA